MAWPSRRVEDALRHEIAALRVSLADERDRYERLVDKLASMQRQGFTPPAQLPDGPIPTPALDPKIIAAIGEHMDIRGQAGRQTADLAKRWLAAGDPIEAIVARIHEGAA